MKPKLAPLNEGGTTELLNKVMSSLRERQTLQLGPLVACTVGGGETEVGGFGFGLWSTEGN